MRKLKVRNLNGRRTFDFILTQVRECYDDLELFFVNANLNNIICEQHLRFITDIKKERVNIDIQNWVRLDIAYIIVFIGITVPGQKAIKNIFRGKYKMPFIESILFLLSKKPHKDSEYNEVWLRLCEEDFFKGPITKGFLNVSNLENLDYKELVQKEGKYYKYFGGHQYKLSHYFRHLYQTVKYIDKQDVLTYREKCDYTAVIRAQLSTPEQMLFFINSVSSLGWEWEIEHAVTKNVNRFLITKYNLIRNVVDLTIDGMTDILLFYPDVEFQFERYPKNRAILEKQFF